MQHVESGAQSVCDLCPAGQAGATRLPQVRADSPGKVQALRFGRDVHPRFEGAAIMNDCRQSGDEEQAMQSCGNAPPLQPPGPLQCLMNVVKALGFRPLHVQTTRKVSAQSRLPSTSAISVDTLVGGNATANRAAA